MANTQSATKQTDVAGKSQETPTNPPTKDADVPVYTEAQLQGKLSAQQSKIRKEIQPLKDEIVALKAAKSALEATMEDIEVLKETVAKLHGEIEDGLPEDAKEAVNKYLKKMATLTESEKRMAKDWKSKEEELSQYRKSDLEKLADTLVLTFGVSKEDLDYTDAKSMRASAVEHFDPAKLTTATQSSPEAEATPDKLPSPDTTSRGVVADPTESQKLKERYPTMK